MSPYCAASVFEQVGAEDKAVNVLSQLNQDMVVDKGADVYVGINKDSVVDMIDFAIITENWLQSSIVEE